MYSVAHCPGSRMLLPTTHAHTHTRLASKSMHSPDSWGVLLFSILILLTSGVVSLSGCGLQSTSAVSVQNLASDFAHPDRPLVRSRVRQNMYTYINSMVLISLSKRRFMESVRAFCGGGSHAIRTCLCSLRKELLLEFISVTSYTEKRNVG